jgi:hypothetical protein
MQKGIMTIWKSGVRAHHLRACEKSKILLESE